MHAINCHCPRCQTTQRAVFDVEPFGCTAGSSIGNAPVTGARSHLPSAGESELEPEAASASERRTSGRWVRRGTAITVFGA
jgi:hypothetical protein